MRVMQDFDDVAVEDGDDGAVMLRHIPFETPLG